MGAGRFGLLAVAFLGLMQGNAAAAGFADSVRHVFVTSRDSGRVSVIDSRDDTVIGTLDLGLVPSQLETTGDSGRLLALDGVSSRVAVVVLDSAAVGAVDLDFVPTRLAISGDGAQAVAASPESGRLVVIDLRRAEVVARDRRAPFRDVVAAGDRLVLAPDTGLDILDLATLRPLSHVPGRAYATLSRAPSTRMVYARALLEPLVAAVDVRAAKLAGEVATTAPRAYTNAIGITMLLPEAEEVAVLPASLKGGVRLKGEAGVTGIYSGWFDTVAFLPSAASRKVMVVDQPTASRGEDIVLGAVPGRGTVTPDGRKLYLPLTDTNRVAVIDAEKRVLSGYVALPERPSMALMARTFGICH